LAGRRTEVTGIDSISGIAADAAFTAFGHQAPLRPSESLGGRTMPPIFEKEIAILERLDRLPDSAAVSIKNAALLSGISERTWRRNLMKRRRRFRKRNRQRLASHARRLRRFRQDDG
jgi:hypothetical protein